MNDIDRVFFKGLKGYEIRDALLRSGGATYDVHTHELIEVDYGYGLGIENGRDYEKIYPVSFGHYRIFSQILIFFFNKKVREVFATNSQARLGLWEDRGKLYIDISEHVEDLDEALALAKKRQQIAIWDCKNKKAIYL